MAKRLAVVLWPHIEVGVSLEDYRLGVNTFDTPKAAEAGGVLTSEHHREPCLARRMLSRIRDGVQRVFDAGVLELDVAEVPQRKLLQIAIQNWAVRLQRIRHVPHGGWTAVRATAKAFGYVEWSAEDGGRERPGRLRR